MKQTKFSTMNRRRSIRKICRHTRIPNRVFKLAGKMLYSILSSKQLLILGGWKRFCWINAFTVSQRIMPVIEAVLIVFNIRYNYINVAFIQTKLFHGKFIIAYISLIFLFRFRVIKIGGERSVFNYIIIHIFKTSF